MRAVLALSLVALGALAAYASGPGSSHGGYDSVIAGRAQVSAGNDGRAPAVSVAAPPDRALRARAGAVTDVRADGNGLAEMGVIAPVAPRSLDLRVILSGHSLT
ncbi:MAG TPA: hypothetical protein GX700_13870, partial [Paracoccus sp.]|nr:hypothetical protein [Paracoccus sp. (in: a-proteobacteria)]